MVMSTQSLANVKARLSEIISSVQETHERVIVTKNGKPAAVIISPDDLEALEETLAVLSDPEAMAAIRAGEEAADQGDFISEAEIRAAVASRRTAG